jgi:predicted nucleotidyltransferase
VGGGKVLPSRPHAKYHTRAPTAMVAATAPAMRRFLFSVFEAIIRVLRYRTTDMIRERIEKKKAQKNEHEKVTQMKN